MIIVCPYSKVREAVAAHKPGSVISILERKDDAPDLSNMRHLKLAMTMSEAVTMPSSCCDKTDPRVTEIVAFAHDHDWSTPLLVHCRLGVCRSPAVAYVIMCALSQPGSEEAMATMMSAHLSGIDPCLTMVMNADRTLGRDGAMIDAVTCMDCDDASTCGEVALIPFTPAGS